MRRITARLVGAGLLAAGLLLGTVALVSADDETGDVEIKVQAPVDAVTCGTPSTITVLGLSIDITNASADSESQGSSGEGSTDGQGGGGQGSTDGQGSDDGQSTDPGQGSGGCTALMVAQAVEVKLPSDATPLAASSVEPSGGDSIEPDLQAPLQAVDTAAKTITLLGLVIDASNASLDGASNNSSDGTMQPLDLSQLMVGQSVEARLDASKLPSLVATRLEVKNFTNQVQVEVDDTNGTEVDDVDENGQPMNDVNMSVTETVKVQNPSGTGSGTSRTTVRLQAASHGRFTLSGLPIGKATIVVTRTANGTTKTAHKKVKVLPNTSRAVRLRLRSH